AAIEVLDPSAVRRWCTGAVAGLEAARAEIDRLNVYPVPDGDTGTNLLLTLQAADSAVRTDPPATWPRRWARWRAGRCSAPAATPGSSSARCCAASPSRCRATPTGPRWPR